MATCHSPCILERWQSCRWRQWWTVQKGAATPEPTLRFRGLTQNSRAGNPKRKRPNCHCKSPRSRGVGTPRVCRPADYLPPGTVGQWPPATGQWWILLKGRRP